MWMQVLSAAGLPVLGRAFPRNWAKTIKDANPDGFYESLLREGIYYRTNPHPETGLFFGPEDVKGYVVKVFIPGVVRSERSYMDLLIANVRAWRDYEASILRLIAMERSANKSRNQAPLPIFPPAFEWWMENFALIRDINLRSLPVRLQTYERVIADPASIIAEIVEAIGTGDVEAAVAAVKPERRTQSGTRSDSVEPRLAAIFDDLYETIDARRPFTKSQLRAFDKTNRELLPRLSEIQHSIVKAMADRGPSTSTS